jgi:hypothetical protein
MAAYRLLAAQHLATGVSPLAVFGDATLAAFPELLADYQLLSVSSLGCLGCLCCWAAGAAGLPGLLGCWGTGRGG